MVWAFAAPIALQLPKVVNPLLVSTNHNEKPERFDGLNLKRWQQKMLFYWITMNLARFLTEDAPSLPKSGIDVQVVNAVDA